jgi:hypothetical protein
MRTCRAPVIARFSREQFREAFKRKAFKRKAQSVQAFKRKAGDNGCFEQKMLERLNA